MSLRSKELVKLVRAGVKSLAVEVLLLLTMLLMLLLISYDPSNGGNVNCIGIKGCEKIN